MNLLSSQDYYELLGVQKDASNEAIKEAYREIARAYHPDSNFYAEILSEAQNAETIEIFKRITEAYHTLSDPKRRSEYDDMLPKGLRGWNAEDADLFRDNAEKMKMYSLKRQASGQVIFGRAVDPSIFENEDFAIPSSKKFSKAGRFLAAFALSAIVPILGITVFSWLFR
jgi:DnaJ-class molecular chaperone